jgi:2'-5' RNA ligase
VLELGEIDLRAAIKLLEDLDMSQLLEPSEDSLAVSLKGLTSSTTSKRIRALYVEPRGDGERLRKLFHKLRDVFLEARFMNEEDRDLKGCTVLRRIRQEMVISAEQILEQFKDFTWCENVVLDRLAICKMSAKTVDSEEPEPGAVVHGYYMEVAVESLLVEET